MSEIRHRTVETNGIRMHVAEAGAGPLVVLCHGFPESWYSWRHQLAGLAEAGFHAVAPDMRGYGQTDAPAEIEAYTLLHLVGDIVGLVDALGEKTAVVAGHDWGAPVAWHAALLRPDVFRAVIGLSVPFRPRTPDDEPGVDLSLIRANMRLVANRACAPGRPSEARRSESASHWQSGASEARLSASVRSWPSTAWSS